MNEVEGAEKAQVIVFQDSQNPGEVVQIELTEEGTRLSRLDRATGEEIRGSVVHGRRGVEQG